MARRRCGERDGHSSATPVARRLKQPTRTATRKKVPGIAPRAVPIRSCSRWGLPCRLRCRRRGALLPHRFTLTAGNTLRAAAVCSLWHCPWTRVRRTLSGTVHPWSPDFPPRHPHPTLPRLRGRVGRGHGAAVRPTDGIGMGCWGAGVKVRRGRSLTTGNARQAVLSSASRAARRLRSVSRVEVSAMPSICAGRKRRWKAVTAYRVVSSKSPLSGTP